MQERRLDLISTMRSLSSHLRGDGVDLGTWTERWEHRLAAEGRDPNTVALELDRVNPLYIPRNHVVESVLQSATEGNAEPFRQVSSALNKPYTASPGSEELARPGPEIPGFRTYCGT